MPLTDLAVKNAEPRDKAYKLSDSQGLFLLVNPNGAKYWRLKYRFAGKEKLLALGVYCGPTTYSASGKPEAHKVQMRLADARAARDTARDQIKAGIDPSEAKRQDEQARRSAAANSLEAVAQEWHTNSRAKWSPDHADRVWKRIADDVLPTIGRMAIEPKNRSYPIPSALFWRNPTVGGGAIPVNVRLRCSQIRSQTARELNCSVVVATQA